MSALVVLASAAAVLGALGCAVGGRAIVIAAGAAMMLSAAALVAEPAPSLAIIAMRIAGAALAGAILAVGLRERPAMAASAVPWPGLALLAAAAWVVGFGGRAAAPESPDAVALGTAVAIAVVGVSSLAGRAHGVQRALAGLPVVVAAELAAGALVRPATALDALLAAGIGVAAAALAAFLATPEGASGPPVAAASASAVAPADQPDRARPSASRR